MARDMARFGKSTHPPVSATYDDVHSIGIRVVSIAPSSFQTPLIDQLSEKVRNGLHKSGVLFPKRYGLPREYARTVRWILETGYVNGEDYRLSGGGRVPAWL